MTVGAVTGNDSEQMIGSDLVVLWGVNAAYTTINVMTLVRGARDRGARVICIDPYRTRTAKQADLHLMVRPGTDGALALAVMHVLIGEGLIDRDYIDRATTGYERLAAHVAQYSPAALAAEIGLDAATIVRFARWYGATRKTFIRAGIGLSRHDNGGMTCRAIACLPALTGAYADPNGGALLSSTDAFGLNLAVLERPDSREAAFLEHARGGEVLGFDVGDDLLDPHLLEAVPHPRLRGLARVAATPAVAAEPVRQLPLVKTCVEVDAAVSDELAGLALPHAPRHVLGPGAHLLA